MKSIRIATEGILKSRIAPTPSGYLHTGNAFNFILTWLITRKNNGLLRLRIDDLDTLRSAPAYIEDIFRSLEWLGLDWDEGPQTPDEEKRFHAQMLRSGLYEKAIEKLAAQQKLFACSCSNKDIHQLNPQGNYAGTCELRHLPLDTGGTALRLLTTEPASVMFEDIAMGSMSINVNESMHDFVVRRKDGIAAYQLASLIDDTVHGVNMIVRGADLLPSTAAQLFLAQQLGLESFAGTLFYHHHLVNDAAGYKLSKSAGSYSLKQMRENGTPVNEVYKAFSRWMNLPVEAGSAQELLNAG